MPENKIPYGYCHCGCGQKTRIAKNNDAHQGRIKGQPLKYIHGHNNRKRYDADGPNPSGLCMCGCGQPTPLSRQSDSRLGYVKGKPVSFVIGHNFHKGAIQDRFLEKVDKRGTAECWEWTGATLRSGYGQFTVASRTTMLAHRFSYELHCGPIPEGLFVCHHCDNRKCVNPEHLWLGTNQDNMNDMVAKGRSTRNKKSIHPSASTLQN